MPSVIIKRKVDRPKGREGKWQQYSPKQRLEVVTAYLMLGKVSLAAAATGIPEETIHRWKTTDWFKAMVAEVRSSSNVEVSGRLRQVINKSLNVIEDRLENGDFQFNPKTGKFVRRPVGAKVAGDIMTKALDKQILIDKIESSPQADQAKIEDRLKAIQEKLLEVSRFNNAKTINGESSHVQESDSSNQGLLQEGSSEGEGSSQVEG